MKLFKHSAFLGLLALCAVTENRAYNLQVENYSPFTVHVYADVLMGCSSHDWCVVPPSNGQYWDNPQALPSGAPYGAGEPKSIADICLVKSVYAEICPSKSCTGDARLCSTSSSVCTLPSCKVSQNLGSGSTFNFGGYTFRVFGDPKVGLTDIEVVPH